MITHRSPGNLSRLFTTHLRLNTALFLPWWRRSKLCRAISPSCGFSISATAGGSEFRHAHEKAASKRAQNSGPRSKLRGPRITRGPTLARCYMNQHGVQLTASPHRECPQFAAKESSTGIPRVCHAKKIA